MAFAPIFNAQNIMSRGETCGMGQINPNMRDLDIPSIKFNTTINFNGGFGYFGKANFGSGLMGGFSGTGFGIGGMFGGGRMTTGSFLGGLLGRTLSTAMNVGLFAAFNKLGGGYGGYRGGYGGSIFGGGYGTGYGGGTGWMLDSCYLNPASRIAATTAGTTTAGTTTAGTTTAGTTTAGSGSSTTGTGSGNQAADNNGNGSSSGTVKDKGNRLFQAVGDKNKDGTKQIYSGVFFNKENSNLEQGATLKQDESTRKQWHKGTATNATNDDYEKAVRLGVAKGSETDAQKADEKTGAPLYFTMTDYRSGNEYTFKLITDNGDKIQYKIDKNHSNLTHDDNRINEHNWEFASGAENLVFDVEVDESSHEIKLSYKGDKVSTDQLVVDKKS